MSKTSRRNIRRKKSRVATFLKWTGVAMGVALLAFGLSQLSGVAYSDADIAVVDFSMLTSAGKRSALQAANRARCSCGCGMTLAQCVATDSTCPIREENVRTIRTMVREAGRP
jgi:hypothetical protein